jgi:hypothetical protein
MATNTPASVSAPKIASLTSTGRGSNAASGARLASAGGASGLAAAWLALVAGAADAALDGADGDAQAIPITTAKNAATRASSGRARRVLITGSFLPDYARPAWRNVY